MMLISLGGKKRTFSFLTTTFISILYSTMSSANPINTDVNSVEPRFVAGFYSDNEFDTPSPLLLSSKDNGQSWSFIKNVPMSSRRVPHFLESMSCTGNTCVAGGFFGDYYPFPLLLKTNDGGQSWSYERDIKGLPKIESSYIFSTNCSGNICLANGAYSPKRDSIFGGPLLLVSGDKGQSWTSINNIKDSPSLENAVIFKALCEGNACVGIFDNTDTWESKPIVSEDKGQSWSYVKTIANVPQNERTRLLSLRCQDNTCVASGTSIPSDDRSYQPLLTISQDKGLHWSYVKDITGLPPMKRGYIAELSYAGDVWIAAGSYGNTNDTEVHSPLLLVSKDKGLHWSFVKNIVDLPDKSTSIQSVACQEGLCIAGGYYLKDVINEADGFELPLLLVSNDKGQSFKFIKDIANLPPMKGASIHSINCKEGNCTAVGHYDDIKSGDEHNSAIYFPFVLTSNDKGEHWSFVTISDLPDMKSGNVSSITGTNGGLSLSSTMSSKNNALKSRLFHGIK